MAESILKIHTQNGNIPVGYPGLANKPIADKTLSEEGAFADSKAVGDKFKEVKEKMDILEKDTVFLANSVENPELFLIDATFTDGVSSGVIYKWNESKRECAVSGIANNLSLRNIFYSETSLPRNIKAGYKYSLKYKTTNKNIRLVIGCFLNGATSGADRTIITDDTIISIPGNCTGMYIRYEVSNGLEANGSITNVRIFKNNNSHSLSGPLLL